MKKKKKIGKKVIVECHRHVDQRGNKFGGSHPTEAKHKKSETQAWHDWTINYALEDKKIEAGVTQR